MSAPVTMRTFDELAASRRAWLNEVLEPWCRRAPRRELLKAEADWQNIAGRADAEATLWTWAWSRFPALVHEGIAGVNETAEVRVTLTGGGQVVGYPDSRKSKSGQLVLVVHEDGERREAGPFSIDEIASVERTG